MRRRMTSTTRCATLLVVLLAVSACRKAAPVDYSGPTADWPVYGGNESGQRYSRLAQITKENVSRLKVAWEYHSGDVSDGKGSITTSSLQVTPIVIDSVMYFCTPFNRVIALNAA